MADSSLVMVNADFPRNKKNQLSKEAQKENDELAEKYNSAGKFPYTVLLTTEGKVLKAWDGVPAGGAEAFAEEIQTLCDANRK